jgi:predicted permease
MPLYRRILSLVSRLVPKDLRAEWLAEWHAELDHRERTRLAWTSQGQSRRDLAWRSIGAFWDALWLQSSRWYSLRLFGQHWRLALAAVLSLGTALAATTIGFTAYDALLLRPPGVSHPDSLQVIDVRSDADPFGPVSIAEFKDYRAATRAFTDIAAFPYWIATSDFASGDRSAHAVSAQISTNYFSVLGVSPAAGSLALRASTDEGAEDIVISDGFARRLGAGKSLVGSKARFNNHEVVIIGVAPPTFRGMLDIWSPDVWMSFEGAVQIFGADKSMLTDRKQRSLHMVGRLAPGVTRQQASSDVARISAILAHDHPDTDKGRTAFVSDLAVTPPGDRGWTTLLLGGLLLIVVLALVVACANVTNLLLGLATTRRHEMLVRAALGASRIQLIAPLLRESLVVGFLSGVIGLILAFVALAKLATIEIPLGALGALPGASFNFFHPDAVVVIVVLIAAAMAGLATGAVPAWRAAADGLSGAINRARGVAEPRKARIRNVLVVIQMAVATLAMVGVGVAIRSFVNIERAPLGFSARNLTSMGVDLARTGLDERAGRLFYTRMRDKIATLPGVEGVTLADNGPMMGFSTDPALAADASAPDKLGETIPYAIVDVDYFATIGLPVQRGRGFDSRDRGGSPEVAVVDEALAKARWPAQNPIGQQIRLGTARRLVEVIGVVADSKRQDITDDPAPFIYFALAQHYTPTISVIARGGHAGVVKVDAIADALLGLNDRLVLTSGFTLGDLLRLMLLLPRAIVATATIFGALTLALALLGLYSTVFYSVQQRRREMGIRVALGAEASDIFKTVLRRTAWVAIVGALIGVGAGLALLPTAASLFYGIGTIEPVVFGAVVFASTAVALATTYVVARPWTRMASIDLLRRED